MSVEKAKKVLVFGVKHPSFRQSFRNDPVGALQNYKATLKVEPADLTIEELDALVEMTDADYASLQKIAVGLGDDFASEHVGGVVL